MIKSIPALMALAMAAFGSSAIAATPVFPVHADISHAQPQTAKTFSELFTVKSEHDVGKTMSFFAPNLLTYTDSTLGWPLDGFAALKGVFDKYMPQWPATGLSYPVRILGGPNSALVEFIDTKELFGAELHVFGAVDFKDGKIIRWVDYWDGVTMPDAIYNSMLTPDANFPKDFKDAAVGMNATKRMTDAGMHLQTALSSGDTKSVAALLAKGATFEDRTLKTKLAGSAAIVKYWSGSLKQLPYGSGSHVRHVVGGDLGGGVEWIAGPSYPKSIGATALELNAAGKITRISVLYSARRIPAAK